MAWRAVMDRSVLRLGRPPAESLGLLVVDQGERGGQSDKRVRNALTETCFFVECRVVMHAVA
jgi:hypothetical protein